MRLWLDDIREPWKHGCVGWDWAKTAEEAIAFLRTGTVTIASLDHDLTPEQTLGGIYGVIKTDGQKSGYDVVVWLEEHPEFWPADGVRVHSMNPAGRKRMLQVIERHYNERTG
jgi:hypothetical protein